MLLVPYHIGGSNFRPFCCFQCPAKQLEATVDPVSSPSNMPMRPSPSAHPSKIRHFLYVKKIPVGGTPLSSSNRYSSFYGFKEFAQLAEIANIQIYILLAE
jgi:hypothetical protein